MTKIISDYEQSAIDFLQNTNTSISFQYDGFRKHFDNDKEERNVFAVTLKNDRHKFRFHFGQSIANSTNEIQKRQDEIKDLIEVFAGLSIRGGKISVSRKFTVKKENGFNLSYEEIEAMAVEMEKELYISASVKNKALVKKFDDGIISRNQMRSQATDINLPIGAFVQCISKAIERECKKITSFNIEGSEKIPPTAYDVLACLTKYDVGSFENFCGDFGYDVDSRKAYKTYKAVLREWKNVELLWTPEEIELLQEIQ